MREKLAQVIAIALLALVTGTSYWYSRSIRRSAAPVPAVPGTPDFTADRMVLTEFDQAGRAKHKLFAEHMKHYPEDDLVELDKPRLISLSVERPQFEVRSQRARVENTGERVHMEGQVIVDRAAGSGSAAMQARTEYLLAIPDYDRYTTDRPIEVDWGNSKVTARGMDLDGIAMTVQFDGPGRTMIAPQDLESRSRSEP